MSYVPKSKDVAVVARRLDGEVLWRRGGLPTTGLNNNPNLDVATADVLMYTKPKETQRFLTLLDAHTGDTLWKLETDGSVRDYDTYAAQDVYYHVVSQNATSFYLQANSARGIALWTTSVASDDMTAILLVGGGGVFVFCPDRRQVLAFDQ